MAKQEGKGVNIKPLTVLVIIIFVLLSAVFSATYYGATWWLASEQSAPYQPKYNGKTTNHFNSIGLFEKRR